jgi:predicted FMN-binding regulatory protein PaiB
MDEFAFADLVTCAPDIRITHIPVMLDRTAGKYGTPRGHVSRHNPQTSTFDGRQAAVVVFHGPILISRSHGSGNPNLSQRGISLWSTPVAV